MRYTTRKYTLRTPDTVLEANMEWWAVSSRWYSNPLHSSRSHLFDNKFEAQVWQARRGGQMWVWREDSIYWEKVYD